MNIKILGLRLVDGSVQPLAWSTEDISRKEAKILTKKFRRDRDVVEPVVVDWVRLYDYLSEVKRLPRI